MFSVRSDSFQHKKTTVYYHAVDKICSNKKKYIYEDNYGAVKTPRCCC